MSSSAPDSLALPVVGSARLQILTPNLLELSLVTRKEPDPARVPQWDFVDDNFKARLPEPGQFAVTANGRTIPVMRVGFKRRTLYAPLKKRDLRLGNFLYLELSQRISDGQEVEVKNPDGTLWRAGAQVFKGRMEPLRLSPCLHVNEVGYVPEFPKKAMVGYYLGTMGEMPLLPSGNSTNFSFSIVGGRSGKAVYSGSLRLRPDVGFTFSTYQQVWEADFSSVKEPGEYRLVVPGLGASFPFRVNEGIAAAFARGYALGLYHQRCGTSNELPFTRFIHDPCHTAPAAVPTMQFEATQKFIQDMSENAKQEPRHSAPQLKNVAASLYPIRRHGPVDVSGGHHDAGDYSKYTINSAGLIHALVFAADAFDGVGALDNLGLPESGNGKSDLLEEAKWEADFLAKMQDDDGGFHFLVYPKERAYEDDVLPDQGDPQVVWPKNTSATAAAVAALAQTSSSPLFRKQFPEAAKLYWDRALKGWAFLQKAIAEHGRDGAYQKLSHYGHEFLHDDELAWAAVELFVATGDQAYEKEFIGRFDPTDRETKRWTWVRMFEGYGCAIRSYAFAAKTGRLKPEKLNRPFLEKCRAEIVAAGNDQARFARECAYGSSFPDPSKRFRNAGWYFSNDQAFDLAVASQLDASPGSPKLDPALLEAMVSNLNYEGGCNPVNVCYLTGLGWKRPHDIVHHYAQNDRRALPPSGLPIGNIQAGFQFLHHYQKELGRLSFPPDGAEDLPYPFYDRWGDSFNVTTEFVIVNQGRGLAALALLMTQTRLKTQPWNGRGQLEITGLPKEGVVGQSTRLELRAGSLDLSQAEIVWETGDQEPTFAHSYVWTPHSAGDAWLEVEAQWPDGRRAYAVASRPVKSSP